MSVITTSDCNKQRKKKKLTMKNEKSKAENAKLVVNKDLGKYGIQRIEGAE